jgi:AraC family transcriptional activator of pobA
MDNQLVSSRVGFNTVDLKLKGFKVYEIETAVSPVPSYSRRDFYKICMISGKTMIYFADKSVELDDTFLFFANPHIPYSSEVLCEEQTGYACLFTEEFLKTNDRSESLQNSPLFKLGGTPLFSIDKEQKEFLSTIYAKMLKEQDADYIYKDELVRNYINLIIHEALKLEPNEHFYTHKTASTRITSLFLELLERQFPIESVERPLTLKAPQDYAARLSIHVNHLNRSVKEVTGKSTGTLINERIIIEAKALLQHTDWSIGDIAYGLGFDYPTHFNNSFKKMTGTVPKSIRSQPI